MVGGTWVLRAMIFFGCKVDDVTCHSLPLVGEGPGRGVCNGEPRQLFPRPSPLPNPPHQGEGANRRNWLSAYFNIALTHQLGPARNPRPQ